METKLSQLKARWATGDMLGALRIAARFPKLGSEKDVISRAWEASQRPSFYRQIGRDPERLVEEGLDAMRTKWELC
jgi:hypothetical protein